MFNLLLAILLGLATPNDNSGHATTNSTECNPDCTEDNHTCGQPAEPGPGGDTGHVPPKK